MSLNLLYTSTKTISWLYPPSDGYPGMAYIPQWDACFFYKSTAGPWGRLFRDGTFIQTISTSLPGSFLAMNNGRMATSLGDVLMNHQKVYELEPCTMMPLYQTQLNPLELNNSICTRNDFIDIDKLWLFHKSTFYVEKYDMTDLSLLDDDVCGHLGVGVSAIHWAGPGKMLVVGHTGRACMYDYYDDVVIWKTTIPACQKSAYDTKYNLIWLVHTDHTLKIYGGEPSVSNLANPTIVYTGTITPYRGYEVYTRLTDSAGSPVSDVWVEWWLSGTRGELKTPYSKTNADGYAYNYYYGPASAIDLGSETVHVRVII